MSDRSETLLARIDERTQLLDNRLTSMQQKLEENYVTQREFQPIKSLVYGGVGFILVTVLGAILALIIKVAA